MDLSVGLVYTWLGVKTWDNIQITATYWSCVELILCNIITHNVLFMRCMRPIWECFIQLLLQQCAHSVEVNSSSSTHPPSTISSTARNRPSMFSSSALFSTFFLHTCKGVAHQSIHIRTWQCATVGGTVVEKSFSNQKVASLSKTLNL